jgi:hypothetical protein
MSLLIYYIVLVMLGDVLTYFVGLGVEREWGSNTSLWVFLTLYFLVLWIAWVLAVWMTKPKPAI